MKTFVCVAAFAALCFSACSPSAPPTDGATTPAPAASAASAPPPAMDGPIAGKWRTTVTMMGQTMPATDICYEKQVSLAEAEKTQQQAGMTCSEQGFKHEGDGWIGHSVCKVDMAGKPTTVTTDSKATGDFSSKYTLDISARMDPAPIAGMDAQKMTIVAERLGDCDPK